MTTYTATLPNGSTETRNSKRTYTHAVIVRNLTSLRNGEVTETEWALLNWCGSAALAQKAAEKAGRGVSAYWADAQVIEVSQ